MAKKLTAAEVETAAVEAILPLLADPAPRILQGTKTSPGIITGQSAIAKAAAETLKKRGWIKGTGEYIKVGKIRKELFMVTGAGIAAAYDHSSGRVLLDAALAAAERLQEEVRVRGDELRAVRDRLGGLEEATESLTEMIRRTGEQLEPPDLSSFSIAGGGTDDAADGSASDATRAGGRAGHRPSWHDEAVELVGERIYSHSLTLTELYEALRRRRDLSLSEYHEGLRKLHQDKRIKLRPYTGSLKELLGEPTPLYLNGEVMFYAAAT